MIAPTKLPVESPVTTADSYRSTPAIRPTKPSANAALPTSDNDGTFALPAFASCFLRLYIVFGWNTPTYGPVTELERSAATALKIRSAVNSVPEPPTVPEKPLNSAAISSSTFLARVSPMIRPMLAAVSSSALSRAVSVSVTSAAISSASKVLEVAVIATLVASVPSPDTSEEVAIVG